MDLFFQLIQVSIGRRAELSRVPSAEQWKALLGMAVKQSLVGVCGSGIERLPMVQRPPQQVAMQWAFLVSKIEQRNAWMNVKCGEITELLDSDGFCACVLKGQGMAALYPDPLRRQPGDIDILCWPKDARADSFYMEEIVSYVRSHSNPEKIVYHHVDMDAPFGRMADGRVAYMQESDGNDVGVEVHYRPSWFFSPFRNRRLQRWYLGCRGVVDRSPDGLFFVPTISFNAVYILTHIFRHLFDEGVGLRQLLDYYYVVQGICRDGGALGDIRRTLKRLGLYRFCAAVMYVLHEVFGLDEQCMIVPMDSREGRFLLDEIMTAGNFGRYDERSKPRQGESLLERFVRRQRRAARFLGHYPEETVFAPLWTAWQYTWRKLKGY